MDGGNLSRVYRSVRGTSPCVHLHVWRRRRRRGARYRTLYAICNSLPQDLLDVHRVYLSAKGLFHLFAVYRARKARRAARVSSGYSVDTLRVPRSPRARRHGRSVGSSHCRRSGDPHHSACHGMGVEKTRVARKRNHGGFFSSNLM